MRDWTGGLLAGLAMTAVAALALSTGCRGGQPAKPASQPTGESQKTSKTDNERALRTGRSEANNSPRRGSEAQRGQSHGSGRATRKGGRVVVRVTGLRNQKGKVLVALYRGAKGFPEDRDRVVRSKHVEISGGSAKAVFEDVAPGELAVAVLHDENGNLKMDWFLGLPKEGYGISRNAHRFLRPPRYEDARMKLARGATLQVPIRMRYLGKG